MEHLSRRRFLKISAASLRRRDRRDRDAMGSDLPLRAGRRRPGEAATTTVPTFCEMCFWRCAGIASVRDGKLWKFEGNPLDPLVERAPVPARHRRRRRGSDSDWLRQPLLYRVGARGNEQWKSA